MKTGFKLLKTIPEANEWLWWEIFEFSYKAKRFASEKANLGFEVGIYTNGRDYHVVYWR